MNAELVLDRVGARVVAGAERAIRIDREFGHQEQREAARAGGRVRQPRQHQVDDVVGEIMLPVGDEDLLPADPIGAVARALGLGAQGADVGAGLRLGELHGAHPFAGDELGQIGALERVAAVVRQRLDARHGQHRADAEGHVGRVPHFEAGRIDGLRQVLAAPLGRRRQPVPAPGRPISIGQPPARRRGDGTVLQRRAVAIADRVERRQHVAREAARLGQHRIHHVLGEIAIEAFGQGRRESARMLEREGDVGDRCPVSHGMLRGRWRSCRFTAARHRRRVEDIDFSPNASQSSLGAVLVNQAGQAAGLGAVPRPGSFGSLHPHGEERGLRPRVANRSPTRPNGPDRRMPKPDRIDRAACRRYTVRGSTSAAFWGVAKW